MSVRDNKSRRLQLLRATDDAQTVQPEVGAVAERVAQPSEAALPSRSALQVRLTQLNSKIEYLIAQHAAEKQQLASDLTRLSDAMAHELREPLYAIQRQTHRALHAPAQPLSSETHDSVTQIAHHADQLLCVLDALIKRARVDARQQRSRTA